MQYKMTDTLVIGLGYHSIADNGQTLNSSRIISDARLKKKAQVEIAPRLAHPSAFELNRISNQMAIELRQWCNAHTGHLSHRQHLGFIGHLIIIQHTAISGIGCSHPLGSIRSRKRELIAIVGDDTGYLLAAIDYRLCKIASHQGIFSLALLVGIFGTRSER